MFAALTVAMGIKSLMKLINEKAPDSIKSLHLESFNGQTIAWDASLSIYQFLVSTISTKHAGVSELRDDEGNLTGHLVGLFNRTIQFMENGIRPIWVFDGTPPDLKSGELEKRKKNKEYADEQKKDALEEGDAQLAKKMAGRSVRVTKSMIEDAKKLFIFMGVPIVEAPWEAEAQCSELVKGKKAFATATEDMDALTFGSTYLIRGFNSKKEPITQIYLPDVLKGLELNMDEFIDLWILCGWDYTPHIQNCGPSTALKMIKNYGSIEEILKVISIDSKWSKKFIVPDPFNYEQARELFKNHSVRKCEDIKITWKPANKTGLMNFLVEEKKFLDKRVEQGIKKLKSFKDRPNQVRLDNFFKKPAVVEEEVKEPEKKKAFKPISQTRLNVRAKNKAKEIAELKNKKKRVLDDDNDEEETAPAEGLFEDY